MAIWRPKSDESVGKTEPLGRRLFDEPMLAGASDTTKFDGLDLRNFEETRDREFSLDRLGRTGLDNRVVNYLLPRAKSAGESFSQPRKFDGWAILRADKLQSPPKGPKLPPVASPTVGDGLAENVYHAHVLLPEEGEHAVYRNALHLRFLFARYGMMYAPPVTATSVAPADRQASMLTKLRALAKALANWWYRSPA